MTVREWMDENLSKMSKDKNLYKIYRRIMHSWHLSRGYGAGNNAIMDADVKHYLKD